MNIKIGDKIKSLRKKSDVTQERFAEYLGITPQAVSRWESETAYPDIEIIPSIANFFNVTADELLGIDITKNQEKIDKIYEQMHEKANKGLVYEELEIARNSVQEFPNDYGLLSHLAHVLGMINPKTHEERQKNLREAIAINERILADCTDDEVRDGVLQKLSFNYKEIGEKEKAVKTAMKLSYMYCTWNQVLTKVYEDSELHELIVNNIRGYIDLLTGTLTHLGWSKYKDDLSKKIKIYKKAVDLIELMWENGDYGFYSCRLAEYYMDMAKSYIELNDVENTLDCFEKCVKYAVASDTAVKMEHTSVIFENTNYDPSGPTKNYDYNECYRLLHTFGMDEKFVSIKDNEQYKTVVAELEKYAKKEQ
ncbi:MAG: helix-turn-helix domain-containing protein [Oscillospiraceae bacterium]|nr:helix-turn-helix domain-containing protein [Oscillospiraceae bacterium]